MELWWMWSTPSLPLLPGPLWSRVVVPIKIISMGQIKLFIIYYTWNPLIVCKRMCWGSYKSITYRPFVYKSYISNIMNKQNLTLNNIQRLICRKMPQPTFLQHAKRNHQLISITKWSYENIWVPNGHVFKCLFVYLS